MIIDTPPKNTNEWNVIMQSNDYEEAFQKCARYIKKLQMDLDKYKSLYESERKRTSGLTVDDIFKKSFLDKIRNKERNKVYESEKDWSGLQDGF